MRGLIFKREKEQERVCECVCVTHPPARNDNSLNSIPTWRASLLLFKRWHMPFPTSLCFLKPVWLHPVRVQGEREKKGGQHKGDWTNEQDRFLKVWYFYLFFPPHLKLQTGYLIYSLSLFLPQPLFAASLSSSRAQKWKTEKTEVLSCELRLILDCSAVLLYLQRTSITWQQIRVRWC